MNPYPPRYDDNWVLKELNRASDERSTTATESAHEDNPFEDPSIAPSAFSEVSSYFLDRDTEIRKLLRSDAPLNSVLPGPHPADIAGMVDGYLNPEQYPTSADLDNDVSMGDAQDAADNVDNHCPSTWPSSEIPFRPSTSGSNGLLAPPSSHTRRSGGRNRNATLNWNPGTEPGMLPRIPQVLAETNFDEGHRTPAVVPEQDYFLVPSIAPSTVNQSFASGFNEDAQMTVAPAIPIINEPLPFTLPETQNILDLDPQPHMSANLDDDLLSLDTQSVNGHELISDVSSNASVRSRKLKDREKTKRVRKKGACSACRIQRIVVRRPSSSIFQARRDC